MNYVNTFIEIAPDTKAKEGAAPKARAGSKTVAELEFELISRRPYAYTHEDVQFHVYAKRAGLSAKQLQSNGGKLREAFFANPMACMRCSPLPRTYGWGLHFNQEGQVALVSVGTSQYTKLANDPNVEHTRAMRSKRA